MLNLAKRSQKRSSKTKSLGSNRKKVLAIDLGGTKIAVAVVDVAGHIHASVREPVDFSGEYKSLLAQISRLARPLILKYKLKRGGIASAGPLDPVKGVLLNPTNFKGQSDGWGVLPFIRDLRSKLKIEMRLENDAAAAAYAEAWKGAAREVKNTVVVTLGTGLGVGAIANGKIVRSGRNLHTEAGHIIMNCEDEQWLCGCGNYGCAEAYLSGVNFTKNLGHQWGEPRLTGEELLTRAKGGDVRAVEAFRQYGSRLASFFCSLCVVFSPELIVISGGFSHSYELFLPTAEVKLKELLRTRREGADLLPVVKISQFQDMAGLLGAARVALNQY